MTPALSILPSVKDIDKAAQFVMDLDLPSARAMLERMDESDCCRAFLMAAQDTVEKAGLRAVGFLVVRAYLQGMLAERSRRDRRPNRQQIR